MDFEDYKSAEKKLHKNISQQIVQAAQLGISTVGPYKALAAALAAQHSCCADLFKIISDIYHGCIERGIETPMLPLTKEVLEAYNNAASSMKMVETVLRLGALDALEEVSRDRQNDSMN